MISKLVSSLLYPRSSILFKFMNFIPFFSIKKEISFLMHLLLKKPIIDLFVFICSLYEIYSPFEK